MRSEDDLRDLVEVAAEQAGSTRVPDYWEGVQDALSWTLTPSGEARGNLAVFDIHLNLRRTEANEATDLGVELIERAESDGSSS